MEKGLAIAETYKHDLFLKETKPMTLEKTRPLRAYFPIWRTSGGGGLVGVWPLGSQMNTEALSKVLHTLQPDPPSLTPSWDCPEGWQGHSLASFFLAVCPWEGGTPAWQPVPRELISQSLSIFGLK